MKRVAWMLLLCTSSWAVAAPLPGLPGLPANVQDFARWSVVSSGAKLPSTGPHAGTRKVVYANPVALPLYRGNKTLPPGSLVVKIAGTVARPEFVAVMQKTSKGWKYEEYFPRAGRFVLIGSGAACSGCHSSAASSDFLFTRP